MATTVPVSTMTALNAVKEITYTAATADEDGLAEVFSITPTGTRGILIVDLIDGTTGGAACAVTVAAGTHWAAKAIAAGDATQDKAYVLEVDTAKVKGALGVISVTVDPGAGDKLKSDHKCKLAYIELI